MNLVVSKCKCIVVQGCMSVSQTAEDGKDRLIHYCYPGGLLGQLQVSFSLMVDLSLIDIEH